MKARRSGSRRAYRLPAQGRGGDQTTFNDEKNDFNAGCAENVFSGTLWEIPGAVITNGCIMDTPQFTHPYLGRVTTRVLGYTMPMTTRD